MSLCNWNFGKMHMCMWCVYGQKLKVASGRVAQKFVETHSLVFQIFSWLTTEMEDQLINLSVLVCFKCWGGSSFVTTFAYRLITSASFRGLLLLRFSYESCVVFPYCIRTLVRTYSLERTCYRRFFFRWFPTFLPSLVEKDQFSQVPSYSFDMSGVDGAVALQRHLPAIS